MRASPLALALVLGCHHDEPVPAPVRTIQPASTGIAPAFSRLEPARDAGASTAQSSGAPPGALPDVRTDWCLEGWRGLDEGTCWLLPDADGGSSPRLLIYLSGIVPPVPRSPQKEKVQQIVAAAARRTGTAVLLPRGRRGIGPADAKDWWAWPTSAADYNAHAAAMVAEWTAARTTLERALGRRFDRVYLAGSSSGAYFLTALALAGALEVDGYAATSGGATGGALGRDAAAIPKRPFYVGYATGDPTSGGPKALAAFLGSTGWPVRVAEHPGGHGAREVYLDEAFAFWSRFENDAGR
jgi:predicted esterase